MFNLNKLANKFNLTTIQKRNFRAKGPEKPGSSKPKFDKGAPRYERFALAAGILIGLPSFMFFRRRKP